MSKLYDIFQKIDKFSYIFFSEELKMENGNIYLRKVVVTEGVDVDGNLVEVVGLGWEVVTTGVVV